MRAVVVPPAAGLAALAAAAEAHAATGDTSSAFGRILPWLGLLVLLVVLGGIVITMIRRAATGHDGIGAARAGFTLHDLRAMHRRGELSDEEFERAKDGMLGRATAGANAAPPAPPADRPAAEAPDASDAPDGDESPGGEAERRGSADA